MSETSTVSWQVRSTVILLLLIIQGRLAAGGTGGEASRPSVASKASIWRTTLTTGVFSNEAVWDSAALEDNYQLLDMAFDAAGQQVIWTLGARPRVSPYRDFYVTLYDHLGRPLIEAPLAWSQQRRLSGTVHLASLDLAWLSRRLGDRINDAAVLAVERYRAREYGRPRQMESREQRQFRLPKQFAAKPLAESVQWDHAGFERCYEVLHASLDATTGRVVWQLEALPRTYPSRAFRAVCYDALGKPLGELPLLWSEGRSQEGMIAIAELDVGYLAEQLKDRAESVARVVIEQYDD
jgi:hypothetical protein